MKPDEPFDTNAAMAVLLGELLRSTQKEQRSARRRRWLLGLFLLLMLLGPLGAFVFYKAPGNLWNDEPKWALIALTGQVGIQGGIEADPTIKAIERAFASSRTAGVVLAINSPGGSPSVAARISSAITRLKAQYDKPIEAVIGASGASAAYLIAIHTDRVTAGEYSAVGSVGAIMAAWNLTGLASQWHVHRSAYTSGSLKGMLDPFSKPTAAADAKAQALVDGVGELFADTVMERRAELLNLTREALTTGEVWLGKDAVDLGLVDAVGNLETVAAAHAVEWLDLTPNPNPFKAFTNLVVDMSTRLALLMPGTLQWQ